MVENMKINISKYLIGLILTWRFGWSHLEVGGGSVTGTTAGMMEGAPRFLQKQKPYKLSTNQMHTPCIVLSNFSIQSRSCFPI